MTESTENSSAVSERFAVWADDDPRNVMLVEATTVNEAIEIFAVDGDIDGVTFWAFPVKDATVVRGEVKTTFVPATESIKQGVRG